MPSADQPTTPLSEFGSAEPPRLVLIGHYGPPTLGLSGARATADGLIRPAPRERLRRAATATGLTVLAIVVVTVLLGQIEQQTATVRQTTISTVDLHVLRHLTLAPASTGVTARGQAAIARQGTKLLLLLEGGGLPANGSDVYAVWLEGPGALARLLGLVSPPVTSTGTFATGATLPSDASSFTTVLISRERTSTPSQPGTPVLTGRLPPLPSR